LREAWDGFGRLGEHGLRSTIGGWLGMWIARRGALDEAEAILDEAIGLSTPDDFTTVAEVQNGRAWVALGRGDHERARALAAEATALVDAHEYITLQQEMRFSRAELLLAAGSADEARAALVAAREVAVRKGSIVVAARVDDLMAGLESR
jgi:ATP/maltotriose-dependent transcriptional regulator MalT